MDTIPIKAWIGIGLVLSSVALSLWRFWLPASVSDPATIVKAVVLAAWSLGPPVWFITEFWAFPPGAPGTHAWEVFKLTQDLASKVWIAMVPTLSILYFGKDILK